MTIEIGLDGAIQMSDDSHVGVKRHHTVLTFAGMLERTFSLIYHNAARQIYIYLEDYAVKEKESV